MTTATAQSPGRPGFNPAELFEPDRRDWLRLLGGVLLAAGFVVLYIRKFEAWGEFPKFLVVLIPFVVLYGLGWFGGLRARDDRDGGALRPEGWQIVFLIIGSLFAGLLMAQLIFLLGADNLEARLHQVLIGLAIAGAAYAASFLRHVPVLALVGGVALLWAWIFLWDKILEIDSIGTGRAFLLIFSALMLAAAFALRSMDRPQAADFITVAGITALIAGLLSLSGLADQFNPVAEDDDTQPTELWNVFILVISLALIAYGARAPSRGPSYVGAIGLASFIGLTGANVVALANGNLDDREKLAGWPLLLLFFGLAALAVSFFLPREGAGPGPGGGMPTTSPEGVPGGPRPGAGYGPGAGQYAPPGQPAGGGYPPPGQQAPPPQQPPPTQQREAWPPPGQQGGPAQGQPQQPGQPPGDATVARPIPPAGDQTVARPIPPQQPPPGGGQQPDPGQQRPPEPPPGG
jgi:hypothetical protein